MANAAPHISIKGETIADFYGFPVTNSLFTSLIVTGLFLLMALYYSSESKKKEKSYGFYIINGAIGALYDLYESVLKNHVNKFFTLLGAFFFFVILNNWFGLLPFVNSYYVKPIAIPASEEKVIEVQNEQAEEGIGMVYDEAEGHVSEAQEKKALENLAAGKAAEAEHKPEKVPLLRAGTADLNTTAALALITVILTQYYGFTMIGAAHHLKKYASPIGFLEGFSELSRILSFSFRLFGNIFAGEVMIVIISFLVPFLTPPFFLLEVFVGFIQAVVFSMLSAVFINLAIQKHH